MSRDVREHRGRLAQVRLGEAQERVAPLARLPFPQPILLPAVAGVVEGLAVELDREPVLGPAAVDALGAGGPVGDGAGQAGFLKPLQEPLLEAAEGDGSVAVHDRTELRGAGLPAEQFLNLRRRRAVANPGLVAGPGEVIDGEGGGQVDEGLGTVVIGMPRQSVALRLPRCTARPFTRRYVGAVTSGGGAGPLMTAQRCAAASPLRTASSPHAQTAAAR